MIAEIKGRILSAIIPGDLLLGTRLGKWYEKNPCHKFDKGDILILKSRRTVGYGIRPVAVVHGYNIKDRHGRLEGCYDITMHSDSTGDFLKWMENNKISEGVERLAKPETHFKWNIEHHFKKADNVWGVEEALDLYMSIVSDKFKNK